MLRHSCIGRHTNSSNTSAFKSFVMTLSYLSLLSYEEKIPVTLRRGEMGHYDNAII